MDKILLLFFILLLVSCSVVEDSTIGMFDTKNWYKKGATMTEISCEIDKCNQICDKRYGSSILNIVDKKKFFKRCMRQSGYYQIIN
jgi:hypothetical protein